MYGVCLTCTIESVKDIERVLAEHGHVFTKVKFSFTIDTVTVALFTKSSKLSSVSSESIAGSVATTPRASISPEAQRTPCLAKTTEGSLDSARFSLTPGRLQEAHRVIVDSECSPEAPKEALAEIALQVVTLKGEMMSDATLVANLVLFDCVLLDTRPEQKGHITTLMGRKSKKGDTHGMVDLTYQQGSANDKFGGMRHQITLDGPPPSVAKISDPAAHPP
ncbi:hypothetical protein GWK47_005662 [Chionoecetes opilio]|uniref:Uncharacterized protein n=1 Tax=Chionoecetes opilio TaxID=41210 RepID=A0A8J4YHR4_CHIOP|nr:hypothetical protein GWK47_005662 [Chionoecetes opilio]